MPHPLYVAFIWHQHQPDYRDPAGGPARLPWARLHAAKDYCHMAELVADYAAIHCTFNYVPSLVDQLLGIGDGHYVDEWQVLSLKPRWTVPEQEFLREHFFSVHPRLLERYPGYVHLRDRREHRDLPDSYFVDLAAWFNLAWIDPRALARDETLRALVAKGGGYTRADVATIIAKHRAFAQRVIPLHTELAQRGQIEISLSPYYHPILPLLINQHSAREALPDVALPPVVYAHPEDAVEQVRRALAAHRASFGMDPQGMWPSEGSVSDALISLLGNDFAWLASDEEVLARSLGSHLVRDGEGIMTNPRVLYQPYRILKRQGRRHQPIASTTLVFRDHTISDRIGFAYQHMPAHDAVGDLMYRLRRIRERLADPEHAYLVSIILDGENAWESYEDNGDPFFRELYGTLANTPWVRTVTVSEYLRENPARANLERLAAGSWINGNFDTWIGEPAQNTAWQLLAQTREALGAWQRDYELADEAVIGRAWDELYIAEGSDWFWWYSSHNNSAQNAMFDELFRGHLRNVYAAMGLPVPDILKQPIQKKEGKERAREISTFIAPRLEGADEDWKGAGVLEPDISTGTMQQATAHMARLYYGYNPKDLFFRIETRVDIAHFRVVLYLATPRSNKVNSRPRDSDADVWLNLTYEIAIEPGQMRPMVYVADGQQVWKPTPSAARAHVRPRAVEFALPRQEFRVDWMDTVGILAVLSQDGRVVELLPAQGVQTFSLGELK